MGSRVNIYFFTLIKLNFRFISNLSFCSHHASNIIQQRKYNVVMFPGDIGTIQRPSSVSATSTASGSSENNADLTKNPTGTWHARYTTNQYLTFNFQQQIYIFAVEMRGDQGYYVKSFCLEYYSETAKQFVVYKVRFYCDQCLCINCSD